MVPAPNQPNKILFFITHLKQKQFLENKLKKVGYFQKIHFCFKPPEIEETKFKKFNDLGEPSQIVLLVLPVLASSRARTSWITEKQKGYSRGGVPCRN